MIRSFQGNSQRGSELSGNGQGDNPEFDNHLDMMVELLEGDFAEKIGFSGKAMAVSSH